LKRVKSVIFGIKDSVIFTYIKKFRMSINVTKLTPVEEMKIFIA